MQQFFSIVSGVLFIAGYVPYIYSIVKGRTKPSKATWIIWASLDVILAIGMVKSGTLNGQMAGACVGASTVAFLSFSKGDPGWTWVDKICLAGAVLGLVAWRMSGDPTFGIVAVLTVIAIGAVPTMLSTWRAPYRENALAWGLFEGSCVAATLAIPAWSVAGAAQPLTFLGITTVALAVLVYRRSVLKPE